jgi:hypothetical protein
VISPISKPSPLVGEFREEVEEVDVAGLHRTLVDVVRADPGGPHGSLVLLGQSLHERVETNLVLERLGDRSRQDVLSGLHIVVQVRNLELVLQVVERGRELVRDGRSGLGALVSKPLLGDAGVLGRGVLADLLLDVLDVGLV